MSNYDKQALEGAAGYFEQLATGANPAPLAFAQAIRRALPKVMQNKPHLWGVMYSDNNRVDAHNVYLTKGGALQRAVETAIPAKVVPLYLSPFTDLPKDWSLAWSSPHSCWQVTGANGWGSDDYTFGIIGSGSTPAEAIQSALSNSERTDG